LKSIIKTYDLAYLLHVEAGVLYFHSHSGSKQGIQMMQKIFLCCAAGMSTSMLVQRMKTEANKRQLTIDIEAVPVADFEKIISLADIVLLGPQVKYEHARLSDIAAAQGKQVEVINMMDYGTLRGDKVLDRALSLIS
jgi:PTS system cellobiose-specific IIB component